MPIKASEILTPEETIALLLADAGLSFERQYVFDAERKWRFDFAFPEARVAIEYDGYGKGHIGYKPFVNDRDKQNAAVTAGWVVLRFAPSHMDMPDYIIDTVLATLRTR